MNVQIAPNLPTTDSPTSRRAFLRRAGLAGAVAAVAPTAAALLAGRHDAKALPLTDLDEAILNFALQTEYFGASYYCYAASGGGITDNGGRTDGLGTQGTVIIRDNAMVPFNNPLIQQLANEFAVDELGHVAFLRNTLASAGLRVYAMPDINLLESFHKLGVKAGLPDATFDPFANDATFLVGAFAFEDVDVTAYVGSAAMITNPAFLSAAAGILAVEAYHAGVLRTRLFNLSQLPSSMKDFGFNIELYTRKISDLRNQLSNGTTTSYGAQILGATSDEPIVVNGSSNIVPNDSSSIGFGRNTREVLNVLYLLQNASQGGFFPNGLNGLITA